MGDMTDDQLDMDARVESSYTGRPLPDLDALACAVYYASNGYIINDGMETFVIQDPTPWDLMWEIANIIGVTGSRSDAKRLTIGYAPGDKHHDYHPQLCKDCICQCDPDQSTPQEGE